MKKMNLLIVMVLLVFTSAFSPLPQGWSGDGEPPNPEKTSGEIDQSTPDPHGSDRPLPGPVIIDEILMPYQGGNPSPALGGVNPMLFDIADTSIVEQSPAVAYCGNNQYLSVYTKSGDIYGQRINYDGNLLGNAFKINIGETYPGRASQPDVACEWSHHLYLVTWTYDYAGDGSDYDVRAQAVNGMMQLSDTQLVGSLLYPGNTYSHEKSPSIACNRIDGNCLIAYEFGGSGNGDIYCRLINVSDTGISSADSPFKISDEWNEPEADPDVAWGLVGENYIVVWEDLWDYPDPDPDRWWLYYAVIYDHDLAGSQIKKAATYAIGGSPVHFVDPAIAYNPIDNLFMTLFNISSTLPTPTSPSLIVARFISGDGSEIPFPNWYAGNGTAPAVTWFGGAEAIPGARGGGKFGISYVTYSAEGGFAIKGMTTGPTVETYPDYWHIETVLYSTLNITGRSVQAPAMCGNSDTGLALLAWQFNDSNSPADKDILGLMLAPFTTYLPGITKP